jgi:hypothetical protein
MSRVIVAINGQVIAGREALFTKVVEQNKQQLLETDAWLRANVPTYAEEIDRDPPDWDKEAMSELLDAAERLGDGNIYYEDVNG